MCGIGKMSNPHYHRVEDMRQGRESGGKVR